MVNIGIGIGRNGFQDWLLQRISAVILGLYFIFLFSFVVLNSDLNYDTWLYLFSNIYFKIASFFAVLSLVVHSWVGIVTVLTDYIKPTWLKIILEVLVILSLILFLIWGIAILWSL